MNKTIVVAKWEYLEKVKSKAFLLGLFITPVLMVTMGVLPTIFATQEDRETKVIGLIDLTGLVAATFSERLEKNYTLTDGVPNYVVKTLATGKGVSLEEEVGKADEKVLDGELEGYSIIQTGEESDYVLEYRSKNVGDFRISSRMEETLKTIMTERKLASLGLDLSLMKQLGVRVSVKTVKLSASGETEESGFTKVFFTAYVFLMMLFFLIITSGQLLVRSVLEEKSNRIVEILVSSCSPTELMAGKVLGLSGLAFTQTGFWTLIGIGISAQLGVDLVDLEQALLLIVYFVLGYLFYAAVFIGVGSPVTTEQEAQQITSYLVIVLILPIVIALPAIQNPDATWLKVLTYVPPLTPTVMALRISILMPSVWEIIATIVLLMFSTYAAMWAAGRVFRVAILATGKRPSVAEILRWVRTG